MGKLLKKTQRTRKEVYTINVDELCWEYEVLIENPNGILKVVGAVRKSDHKVMNAREFAGEMSTAIGFNFDENSKVMVAVDGYLTNGNQMYPRLTYSTDINFTLEDMVIIVDDTHTKLYL